MDIADELDRIGRSVPIEAWDDVPPSDATPQSLWADLRRFRAFAQALLEDWPHDMGIDGFELQDLAIKHGLLAPKVPAPTAPCGENCNCVEYHGSDATDWADGVECFQRTELLVGPNLI